MTTTSPRRQLLITRIVSELTGVASQTQSLRHTHTHTPCLLSRARKDESTLVFLHDSNLLAKKNLISRIASELASVASQTQTQTTALTHKQCLRSRARKDESTLIFLHDGHLSAKTNSDFSYSFRSYQCCLINANTHTQTLSTFTGLKSTKKRSPSHHSNGRNVCVTSILNCVQGSFSTVEGTLVYNELDTRAEDLDTDSTRHVP